MVLVRGRVRNMNEGFDGLPSTKPAEREAYKIIESEDGVVSVERLPEAANNAIYEQNAEEGGSKLQSLNDKKSTLLDDIGYRSLQLKKISPDDPKFSKLRNEQEIMRRKLSEVESQISGLEGSHDIQIETVAPEQKVDNGDTEIISVSSLDEAILASQNNISVIEGEISEVESMLANNEIDPVEAQDILLGLMGEREHYQAQLVEYQLKELVGKSDFDEPLTDGDRREPTLSEDTRIDFHEDRQEPILVDAIDESEETEKLNEQPKTGEVIKESIDSKTEYLRLKGEFKASQREYMQVLEEDYKNRGVLKKVFGLGRKEMSPEVQVAYDTFMKANTAYYGFAQESGVYQKIAERINRDKSPEKKTTLGSAVMGRHVFRPAEERLELQTSHMPEGLINLKEKIISQVKKHPKAAVAVGAALLVKSAVFSLPALLTGLGTRYAGKKVGDALEGDLVDNKKEIGYLFDDNHSLVDSPEIGIDLTELEEEIFSKANRLQKVRTGTNWVAAGAGLAAGGVSTFANAEDGLLSVTSGSEVIPDNIGPDLQDSLNFESVTNSAVEATEVTSVENVEGMFFLGRGDNLSSAMLNQIRERVESGSLQLPKGVELDNISHYIYQSFPEMTSASDVSPRLSPEEWVKLGISSGDPHNIQVGEGIDMEGLIDKMWGQHQEFVSPVPEVSSVEVAVENVQNINTTPTPLESVAPMGVAAAQSGLDSFPSSDEGYVSESIQPNGIDEVVAPESVVSETTLAENMIASSSSEYSPTDFNEFFKEYGLTHRFVPGEKMHEHLLKMMDEMPTELKQKYMPDLFEVNDAGALVEKSHRAFLVERLPEASGLWHNFAPDALTETQWKYVGIPSGDPTDLKGAVLDHARLTEVLFNQNAEIDYSSVAASSVVPSSEVAGVSVEVNDVTNHVEAASRSEILSERKGSFELMSILEERDGYQPKMNPSLESLVTPLNPNVPIIHQVYEQMLQMYKGGEINLPAERMRFIANNETALYSFIEETARELSDNKLSALFGGSKSLDLTPLQWQELGFSSGNPQEIIAGDKIHMGKLTKLILEQAAENINQKN